MALINHAKREINAKLVFYGPARSGKATNLNGIHKKLKPEYRGKLKSMAVQRDRMLFFDFVLPGKGEVDGYLVRFHVYTLAGNVTNPSTWKMVLKGVDGIMFVADSGPGMMTANRQSLATLREQLQGFGADVSRIPCIVQCNKRDLSDALPLEEMRHLVDAAAIPLLPAIASKGEGVFTAISRLVQAVMKELQESGLELQGGSTSLGAPGETPLTAVATEPEFSPSLAFTLAPEDESRSEQAGGKAAEGSAGLPVAGGAEVPQTVVELAGSPESTGGRLRLPLTVRCGEVEKRLTLTLTITEEE